MKNAPENQSKDLFLTLQNLSGEGQLIRERRYFNSLISLIITVVCLGLVGYFIKYVPNEINMDKIKAVYYVYFDSFLPEAPERARYVISTLLFPVLFVFFYWRMSKVKIKQSILLYTRFLFPLVLIFEILIFCVENAANQYILQYSLFYKTPLLTVVCAIFVFLLLWIPEPKYKKAKKIFGYVYLAFCVLLSLYLCSLYVTGTPTLTSQTLFNFDVYYYPVFEVFNGKALVVDFNNIYGFYPYIVAPILKLTGSITIQKFNFVIAALILITLLSLLAIEWLNIKNKVIAFAGFLVTALFIIVIPLSLGEFYYAYQPHRIIFPALILLIGTLFLHAKSKSKKRIWTGIGFLTGCLSLIWNLDTGVVVIIAWCLFLLYTTALDYSLKSWMLYKKAAKIIVYTFLSAAASYGIIVFITFLKTGIWIDINQCFFAQNIFYNSGFNMIPMPDAHPWIILVILYAIGLIRSLRNMKFLSNDNTIFSKIRSSMYFFVSILGVGLFSYYQGRSDDNVFLAVAWPGTIIAAMLLEDLYNFSMEYINKPKKVFHWTNFAKYVLMLFLMVSFMLAVPYTVLNNSSFGKMQQGSSSEFSIKVNKVVMLLKKTIEENGVSHLFIAQQDYYYTLLDMKNQTGLTSCVDWVKREDYDKALHWLDTNREDVIMDAYMIGKLADYSNQEIYELIHSRYFVRDIGEGYYLLTVK